MRFLSKNLKVPESVFDAGQKLKIRCGLLSGRRRLSEIAFLQTTGEDVEHEVARVLNKMPKRMPGMQNGQQVAEAFHNFRGPGVKRA